MNRDTTSNDSYHNFIICNMSVSNLLGKDKTIFDCIFLGNIYTNIYLYNIYLYIYLSSYL